MAIPPNNTISYLWHPRCFVANALSVILIVTVLASCETRHSHMLPMKIFHLPLENNESISSKSPENVAQPQPVSQAPSTYAPAPVQVTSTAAPQRNTADSLTYGPYMKVIQSHLGDYDLEYSLDFYNEKPLVREYEFDPMNIVKRLSDAAVAQKTPPYQFLEEIHDLVSLQSRTYNESDDNTVRDEVSAQLPSLSENLLKRMAEGWKAELARLEQKYNVSTECSGPNSITPTRLALMFPHFINFGQKPFAPPTEISLSGPVKYTTAPPDYNSFQARILGYNDAPHGNPEYHEDHPVPALIKRVEFGGLIPLRWDSNGDERKKLIALHLFAVHGADQNDVLPFRTKCVLLRWRMQRCVLSDARRVRFLLNNDFGSGSGLWPLKPSLSAAYMSLSEEFLSRIDWDIFRFSGHRSESSTDRSSTLMTTLKKLEKPLVKSKTFIDDFYSDDIDE